MANSTIHSNFTGANLHVPGYAQDTDPGAVGTGKYWIDTSGGSGNWVLKVRNVTNDGWEIIASSGGSWKLIESQTVSVDTTTVSFSTNVSGYNSYQLIGSIINNTGSNCGYHLYLNNDTTDTNYYRQLLVADGTGVSAGTQNDSRFSWAGSTAAQNFVTFRAMLSRTPTDNHWYMMARNACVDANGPYLKVDLRNINYYVSAASLTQIDITASIANGIGANSEITLLGLVTS